MDPFLPTSKEKVFLFPSPKEILTKYGQGAYPTLQNASTVTVSHAPPSEKPAEQKHAHSLTAQVPRRPCASTETRGRRCAGQRMNASYANKQSRPSSSGFGNDPLVPWLRFQGPDSDRGGLSRSQSAATVSGVLRGFEKLFSHG